MSREYLVIYSALTFTKTTGWIFFLSVSICGWGIWVGQMMTCSLECQRGNITFLCIKQSELCFSGRSAQNGSSSFGWCWYYPIYEKINPLCLILSPTHSRESAQMYRFRILSKTTFHCSKNTDDSPGNSTISCWHFATMAETERLFLSYLGYVYR